MSLKNWWAENAAHILFFAMFIWGAIGWTIAGYYWTVYVHPIMHVEILR